MNADEAPAHLHSDIKGGDAEQRKGGTQEFRTVDSLNCKKQVLQKTSLVSLRMTMRIHYAGSSEAWRLTPLR